MWRPEQLIVIAGGVLTGPVAPERSSLWRLDGTALQDVPLPEPEVLRRRLAEVPR